MQAIVCCTFTIPLPYLLPLGWLCDQVWDLKEKKLLLDLPGHADEVFSVDWSPDGERVASGGRDRMLKM